MILRPGETSAEPTATPVVVPRLTRRVRFLAHSLHVLVRAYQFLDGLLALLSYVVGRRSGGPNEPTISEARPAPGGPDATIGPILVKHDAPRLFAIVAQTARHFAIEPPREIRLSYLPACGVLELTDAQRRPYHVLIVGLPCLEIWTIEEMRAVLAHEMAHTGMADAYFTREVMEKLVHLWQWTQDQGHWSRWIRPRYWLARCSAGLLLTPAATVSRALEYRADQFAAQLVGSKPLASALAKLAIVQPIFRELLLHYEPDEGVRRNLYEYFVRAWTRMPRTAYRAFAERTVRQNRVGLWDPHPCLAERLAKLKKHVSVTRKTRNLAIEVLANPPEYRWLLHNRLFHDGHGSSSIFEPTVERG